ncbi:MAG TPA: hypothetical protein VEY30_10595, partial [Myxococcaceae bacterium]|nr:hypothetical protein [Myxococcaceae bacterium]
AFDKLCAQLCEAQKVAATPVAPSGKLPGALSESQEILSRQLRNLMKRQKDAALALEEALAPCTDEDPSLYAKRLDRMAAFLDAFVGGLVQEARDQLVLLRGTEALNRLEATFSPDRERPLGTAPSGTDSLYLPPMPSDTPGGLPVAPPLRPGDWVAVAEALERLGPAGQVVSERVYREVVRVVRVRSEVPAGQREPMSLVHFVPPLGRTYPLSRVTLVGNIVPVSHGEAVEEWVTPSADRRTLRLNESPVTWLRDKARAQGRRAEVSLRVAGRAWAQVDSLLEWGRDEQVFSVESLPEGAARIRVGGDGSGAPLPEGAELRVKYRVGRGTAGNVESGRVTELASPHPCVESTLNPLPFSGGSEPEAPDTARTQGPATVGVMDRAVSLPDVEALARVFDGVDRAKVVRDDVRRRVLKVVLSGPGGAALSTEELNALHSFLAVRVPPGVTLHLSNRVVAPVRAKVLLRVQPGADPISVIQQARLALGLDADPGSPPGLLDPRNVALGADLDLSQLYEALAKVDGLRSSVVQQLYRADAAPSLSQRVVTGFNELLAWALPEGKSDGVELTYEEAREL